MVGTKKNKSIETTVPKTKGKAPLKITLIGISGFRAFITNKFNATGGVIVPTLIIITNSTANQIGSNPSATAMGCTIGTPMSCSASESTAKLRRKNVTKIKAITT